MAFPQGIPTYSFQEVRQLTASTMQAYDEEGRQIRRFSAEEDRFIAASKLRVLFDAPYYLNFVFIDEAGHGVRSLYPLWGSQDFMLKKLAYMQEAAAKKRSPDGLLLNMLKVRQVGICLVPETKILTADLRWVRLDTVEVGDELVAVDEFPPGGSGAGRKMRTGVVEAVQGRREEAYELVFDTGVKVVATGEHRFLTRNRGGVDTRWRPVKKMIVGELIRMVTLPWGEPTFEDGWMAGMIDGEGSMKSAKSSGAELQVIQTYGPVYDRVCQYFIDRGYSSFHQEKADTRTPENSQKFSYRPVGRVGIARMNELFKLLGQTRPTRFIQRRWWEDKELPGRRNGFGWARLVEVRPVSKRRVIDLQTSTKTFIAEGLVSHNSTLGAALVSHRIFTQPNIRALLGSDVEEQAQYLFRMVERIHHHLPPWLRPTMVSHRTGREMVLSNGSSVKTAWGKSTRGALQEVGGRKGNLERGRTNSVVQISELATWDNPEQLDSSLLPGIPISDKTLVIFESTAELAGDWWHKHFLAAEDGRSRFQNAFITWPLKYSTPAPEGWTPSSDTLAVARQIEQESPQWGYGLTLTRDHLYWYETTRDYYVAKKQLHAFLKEYPSNPRECFQYAGKSVFSWEDLERIDQQARKLLDVWAVQPSRAIAELKRMKESSGDPDTDLQALGLKQDRRPAAPMATKVPSRTAEQMVVPPGYGFRRLAPQELRGLPNMTHSVLAIYEYPRTRGHFKYVVGVDVGGGLGFDYSSITVTRVPTIEEPMEDVAQYVSNKIRPAELAAVCDAIGRFYSDSDGIEAVMAIELNNHGTAVQDMLQLHLGYFNFFVWEYVDAADPSSRFSKRIGWTTTSRTRPILLEKFHDLVTAIDPITNLAEYRVNSSVTRAEMRHFITETGDLGDAEHAKEQHDDSIFSSAIGGLVAHKLAGGESEPIAERRQRRAQLLALANQTGRRSDYRNSAVTLEEADHGTDPDHEWLDESSDISYTDR